MKKTIRISSEKLKNKGGFTLVETLLVAVVVGMMTMIIGGGLVVVRDAYQKTVRKANAQVLCSTISDRIQTELRGADDFDPASGTVGTFVSHSGTQYDGKRISIGVGTMDGKQVVVVTSNSRQERLIPRSSYVDGLIPEIEMSIAGNLVTLKVRIKDNTNKVIAETPDPGAEIAV